MMSRQHLYSKLKSLIKFNGEINVVSPKLINTGRVLLTKFIHDEPPKITNPRFSATEDRTVKISKAMKSYLDRAQKHDEFLREQNREFETGKRHLANMMGEDPETFTQRDIDEAIRYLMPSGLFDKKARPMMKPPDEIFPKRKAAEFDSSGRPFNTFFYTGNAYYYQEMFAIVSNLKELDDFEDNMIKKGIREPLPENRLDLGGSEWVSYEQFQKIILQEISEHKYNYFIYSIMRLAEHPYSFRCKDFIYKYRRTLVSSSQKIEIPPLTIDENGRTYVEAEGSRKHTKARVTVYGNGTGKVLINGKDITYFPLIQDREQLLFPLQFTNLLNKVDIEAEVETIRGGTSCQSGAIRLAISRALRSFIEPEMVEKMRLAGLLTRDPRTPERKKPGQEGARRKFTWKKR